MKNITRTLLVLSFAVALSACDPKESTVEENTTTEAQTEAETVVDEASKSAEEIATQATPGTDATPVDGTGEAVDAMTGSAEAGTNADTELKTAKEKCDALPAAQQAACNSAAQAVHDAAKTAATSQPSADAAPSK